MRSTIPNIRPDPQPNEHVAFGGGGPHFCLGAHIARIEIEELLREILTRMDGLELAGEPVWLESNFISGLKHLPVRFRPGPARPDLAQVGPLGQASSTSSRGTNRQVRGSPPTLRLMWPCPVRSSARRIVPGPSTRRSPAPVSISTDPVRLTTSWRRGAL